MKRLNNRERMQLWICIERLQDAFIRLEGVRSILENKEWVNTYEDKEPFRNAMVEIKDMETMLREKHALAERIERGEEVAGYVRSL